MPIPQFEPFSLKCLANLFESQYWNAGLGMARIRDGLSCNISAYYLRSTLSNPQFNDKSVILLNTFFCKMSVLF